MPGAFDFLRSLFTSPPVDTNLDNTDKEGLSQQREIERQQTIINSILAGKTNFPPEHQKALAQAYLKNYGDQGTAIGYTDDGHGDAVDYKRGHVGSALEWARRQAGYVPYGVYNSRTKNYDPASR